MANKSKKLFGFNYPSADKIGSRTSTIARSMASTLMPRIGATDQIQLQMAALLYYGKEFKELEEKEQQQIKCDLKKSNSDRLIIKCVYCGNTATHLDHLYPLVDNKTPTGFASEPANLVPCCGKCNQSKGSKSWDVYMDLKNYEEVNSDTNDIKKRKTAIKNRLNSCSTRGDKKIDLGLRKEYLKIYCKYFKFIDTDNKACDDRKLNLITPEDEWWNGLYSEIKIALESADLQIAAFYSGFEDSVNSKDEKEGFELFLNEYKKRKKEERLNCLEDSLIDKAKKAYNKGREHDIDSQHDQNTLKMLKSEESNETENQDNQY